jgi:hypothetical protein
MGVHRWVTLKEWSPADVLFTCRGCGREARCHQNYSKMLLWLCLDCRWKLEDEHIKDCKFCYSHLAGEEYRYPNDFDCLEAFLQGLLHEAYVDELGHVADYVEGLDP